MVGFSLPQFPRSAVAAPRLDPIFLLSQLRYCPTFFPDGKTHQGILSFFLRETLYKMLIQLFSHTGILSRNLNAGNTINMLITNSATQPEPEHTWASFNGRKIEKKKTINESKVIFLLY